ncbi:MAG: manno-octulosonate cytidylyltransferase [Pseudomonadota bacterium]
MSVVIVIPARYASSRYPGKPLVALRGATGEAAPLIERTWRAAQAVSGGPRVVIATDDPRIEDTAATFGAETVMTDPACANGTERCADALDRLGATPDIVVNLQGDAPLTPPWFVDALIAALRADPESAVATPVLRCDAEALARFRADRRAGRVGATTAVFDRHKRALYFSKEIIPFGEAATVYHHVGVYAYTPAALAAYRSWPMGPLERHEGLEQLRFLENALPLACVEVEARGTEFWELNNPEDVPLVEAALAARGLA